MLSGLQSANGLLTNIFYILTPFAAFVKRDFVSFCGRTKQRPDSPQMQKNFL